MPLGLHYCFLFDIFNCLDNSNGSIVVLGTDRFPDDSDSSVPIEQLLFCLNLKFENKNYKLKIFH